MRRRGAGSYADPPTGDRRFEPLAPKKPWNGTLNATRLSPWCTQLKGSSIAGVEDCLYLNVFVPEDAINTPVMFWIHGGAYLIGAASLYDGGNLASNQKIIIVTVNYRLGLFGFGYISGTDMAGNMGLLDQRLALEWTKDNIAAFGGDPSRITIFGESAGSSSVSAHLAAPKSRALFRNAIMESGSLFCNWGTVLPSAQEERTLEMSKLAGCTRLSHQETTVCMRFRAKETVMEAFLEYSKDKYGSVLAPIDSDIAFFNGNARSLARSANLTGRTVVCGTNSDEATMFIASRFPKVIRDYYTNLTLEQYKHYGYEYLKTLPEELASKLMAFYGSNLPKYLNYFNAFVQMYSDNFITCCGGHEQAIVAAERGAKTYMYVFNHTFDARYRLGSYHSLEVAFVFGQIFYYPNATDAEKALSYAMEAYWANIAKFE